MISLFNNHRTTSSLESPYTSRFGFRRMILSVAAVTVLGLAARLGLSDAEKRFNSGTELVDEGRYEEAIADLDRVVEIDPTYAKTYLVRASAQAKLGLGPQYQADH